MKIDKANSFTDIVVLANKLNDFVVAGFFGLAKATPKHQPFSTFFYKTACHFSYHHWMDNNAVVVEQSLKVGVRVAKVVCPDRGVCKNHESVLCNRFSYGFGCYCSKFSGRRRGGASKSGSVPPKAASLRDASRSIRAISPCFTREVFSFIPVISAACANKSSSMFSVVRIMSPPLMHQIICKYMSNMMRPQALIRILGSRL